LRKKKVTKMSEMSEEGADLATDGALDGIDPGVEFKLVVRFHVVASRRRVDGEHVPAHATAHTTHSTRHTTARAHVQVRTAKERRKKRDRDGVTHLGWTLLGKVPLLSATLAPLSWITPCGSSDFCF
jgi:hypothetical protein